MANMAGVTVIVKYKNNAVKEYEAFKELFSSAEEDVTQSYDIIEEYYSGDDELLELTSLVDQTILNINEFKDDDNKPYFYIHMLCDWTFKNEWFDKLLERYFPNLFYYYEVIEPDASLYINTDISRKYISTEYAIEFGEISSSYNKEYYFDDNEELFRILNLINCSNTKLKVPDHILSEDELTALSKNIVNIHTNYKKNNEVIIAETGITEAVCEIEAGDFYCSLFKFQDTPPCL